jgi:hypothetical protein
MTILSQEFPQTNGKPTLRLLDAADAARDLSRQTTRIVRSAVAHYEEARLLEATIRGRRYLDKTDDATDSRARLEWVIEKYLVMVDLALGTLIENMHGEVAPERSRIDEDAKDARENEIGHDEWIHRGFIVDGTAYVSVQDSSGSNGPCVRRVEVGRLVEIGGDQ